MLKHLANITVNFSSNYDSNHRDKVMGDKMGGGGGGRGPCESGSEKVRVNAMHQELHG